MLTATSVSDHPHGPVLGIVELRFEDRYRRRIAMSMQDGTDFLLHLTEITQLSHGDYLLCGAKGCIQVLGAAEKVMEVTADQPAELASLAWHIGNRHLPLQIIEPNRLRLAYDKVIFDMLAQLGATPVETTDIFAPQGGAYGGGPTYGHSHGEGSAH